MNINKKIFIIAVILIILLSSISISSAGEIKSLTSGKSDVMKHWTKERMEKAIPRDLVIDENGIGYLKKPDGSLVPYGKPVSTSEPISKGKPTGGTEDTTPPDISNMNPADSQTIGSSHTFSAKVEDAESGIKSVNFILSNGQSFRATFSNGLWQSTLQGFSDGEWSWHVTAKDTSRNTATSNEVSFIVNTGSTPPPPNTETDNVDNAEWTGGGVVQTAAGRIYFEMPDYVRVRGKWTYVWNAYVCSGTVVDDNLTYDRSLILTAAHCVYDDINKLFARNVLFIPNQDATTGTGTDVNCSNDPLGCWAPSFGVVDENWTPDGFEFPANIEWDYAFYVVDNSSHSGNGDFIALDDATGSLFINFEPPNYDDGLAGADTDDFTHALGYSYSDDPNFMYCAEDMTTEGDVNWWLPSCGLSGGASGGPWIQPVFDETGNHGPIISVNSWGYTNSPGMAGPRFDNTTVDCIYSLAISTDFKNFSEVNDGEAGLTNVAGCEAP